MERSEARTFEFGCYRLEPGTGLTHAGKYVELAPKELRVLEALVRRQGQLASKNELLDEVWPDEAASEESLTRCVYVLRQRLREGLDDPIATVHRRGYRFAVPVRQVDARAVQYSVLERSMDTSATALMAYLEGRQRGRLGTAESLASAITFHEEAARLDPSYAVPLTAIAGCRIHQCVLRWIAPLSAAVLIRDVCERALAIDPLLASAHATLGWMQGLLEWRHDAALQACERALELDSEYPNGYIYRAWVLRNVGDFQAAIADLRIAWQLDPYVFVHRTTLAWTLFLAGQHGEALDLARSTVAAYPKLSTAHNELACIAAYLGEHDEALQAGERAVQLGQRDPTNLAMLAYARAAAGMHSEAQQVLLEIETHSLVAVRSLVYPVYAVLGDLVSADRWLITARQEQCPWLLASLHDPRLGAYAERARQLIATTRTQ